jgi:quercetin dioxygenase-like cupin family protein
MLRSLAFAIFALTLFVSAARADEAVTTDLLLKTGITNIGQRIAYPRHGKPEISAMIVTIAPGASTPLHKHPVPLVGYVLQGQLEVSAEGGKVNRYKAGDAFVEALNHVHQGFNVGTEPVRILVTVIGIAGVSYSVAVEK